MIETTGEGGGYGALGNATLSPRQRLAGSPLLAPFDAIEALLFAAGPRHPSDPMVAGFVDGIRAQGVALAGIGGPAALQTVLALVSTGEPTQGRRRRQIVEAAWRGLEGWAP